MRHDSKVHIVAVSFFGGDDVPRLLRSLQAQTNDHWSLSIVDNSTSQAEYHKLGAVLRGERRATLVSAPTNLGYLGGARLVLGEPLVSPADWTVVCNTDLEFAPDAVQELVRASPDIGVVAPAIISSRSGLDQNPYMTRRPAVKALDRRARLFQYPAISRLYVYAASLTRPALQTRRPRVAEAAARRIYAPHGSCMAFSRRYFSEGGDLAHPVFLFAEELTIADRCERLALPVAYRPEVRVIHREHASTGSWRSRQVLKWQGEALRYAAKLLSQA